VNLGTIVSVRGKVVDARFEGTLLSINPILRAGGNGRIIIEVLRHETRIAGSELRMLTERFPQ
jgi:F-type H+-transporting ATPase subunit beta